MEAPIEATNATAKSRIRRNRSKSFPRSKRCSFCFTPVVVDGDPDEPDGSTVACIPAVPLLPRVSFNFKKDDKKGTRRRLVRAIKAVLFESSLVRKAIKRNLFRKSTSCFFRRKQFEKTPTNFFSSRESRLENEDAKTESNLSESSRNQPPIKSSTLSPCASSVFEKNVSRSFPSSAVVEEGKGHFGPKAGLALLFMSMLVLILWGKICAIIWTSTWLYMSPRWWSIIKAPKRSRSEKMMELPDICSDLYKKKVIMEGLLKRNR